MGSKRVKWFLNILIFVIVVVVLGGVAVHFWTDYIWMDSLGFGSVFTTILGSKVLLAGAGFLLFAGAMFVTSVWIYRTYVHELAAEQLPPLFFSRKKVYAILLGISAVIGFFGSSLTQGLGWERLLKFIHRTSFGQADPFFQFDISFYMFVLPFLEFIVGLLIGLSVFLLLVQGAAYSVFNLYLQSRRAKIHLCITFGAFGVLLALEHALAPFETLLTNKVNMFQESTVYGLSYTDQFINIPKAYVLAGVALIGTVWMIGSLFRRNLHRLWIPVAVYIGVFIVGQVASVAVQNFIVSPNEFSKEKPYLQHNLDFTKSAYGLNEIEEMEHPGNSSLSEDMLERNEQTVHNIRVNDVRPLLSVYNQLQTFRTYYEFNDVDIDRYKVNGDYEQVFIGARELNTNDLPSQAKTWVNRTLRYTHGYGVSMSHVNQITPQGQPEYMVKNIPPKGVVDVERPQIYFGEEPYDYVVVNSKVDEFDHPKGENNVDTRYEARSGIPLTGVNKLLFAIKKRDPRLLVSGQLTSESQLLETRNIMDRLNRIAPVLTYDEDPYIAIRDDGTLVWIVDAYVDENRYPYSEPYDRQTNYIRNPVKAVIDAYTGEVTFYVVEPGEPLLETYSKIFPDLFTDEIPDDIQAHFRYPQTLFRVQTFMYGTYHMSNLEVFYNREDYWEFPTEKYFNEDIVMEPYYITMKLPDKDEEEFILMMPYTPKNRQNMISWMGVRNDGENYGEKFVYRFPKQKNIYGPQQIENRINQDSNISQQLNLWSQGGSKVIRGNLLVIPIEDTVLYVEPVYIESSNKTSLPEVKRMIVAYEDKIVMEPTLEEGLAKILNVIDSDQADDDPSEDGDGDAQPDNQEEQTQPAPEAEEKLSQVAELFHAYQKAVSEGNWEESGRIMEQITELLEEIK